MKQKKMTHSHSVSILTVTFKGEKLPQKTVKKAGFREYTATYRSTEYTHLHLHTHTYTHTSTPKMDQQVNSIQGKVEKMYFREFAVRKTGDRL